MLITPPTVDRVVEDLAVVPETSSGSASGTPVSENKFGAAAFGDGECGILLPSSIISPDI